jgi:hypothetical protein
MVCVYFARVYYLNWRRVFERLPNIRTAAKVKKQKKNFANPCIELPAAGWL